jgi:hypothetical protein
MQKGYIPTDRQDLIWYPQGEKPGLFKARSPNSVPVAQWLLLKGAKVDAYLCRECKKYVLDAEYL